MKTLSVAFVCILLTACGSANRVVVLQNPATKEMKECRVNPLGTYNRTEQVESCVYADTQSGYVVTGDSK